MPSRPIVARCAEETASATTAAIARGLVVACLDRVEHLARARRCVSGRAS